MNPTVTAASAASVPATTRIPATAGSAAEAFPPRSSTAASAGAEPFSADSFATSAAADGRSVEVPVSINRHRARENYAGAASVPLVVDPTAARTSTAAVASAKAGRGKLAPASQWDR